MRVCVFCGSSFGRRPEYREAARTFASLLAERKIELVYGGAHVGLMGVLADAAMAAGGEVIGVIPRFLIEREIGHRGLTDLRVVETMHERKAMMASLSHAFVAFPGGLGTLEELLEILTWGMLGLHAKPFVLLDVEGYYQPLLSMLDHARGEGFVRPEHRALVSVAHTPAAALGIIDGWRPPHVEPVLPPGRQ